MPRKESPEIVKLYVINPERKPNLGERIGVYWQTDKKFYTGEVTSVDQNGKVVVTYDDDDRETLNLDYEIWEFENDPMRYKTVSKNDTESNPSSDKKNDENDARTDKSDRESNENDHAKLGIARGQASTSQQEEIESAGKVQAIQNMRKMRRARYISARQRAQRTRRVTQPQEHGELGIRQCMAHLESVENEQERDST